MKVYYNVYSPIDSKTPVAVFITNEVAVLYFVERFWKFFESIERAKSIATLFIELDISND